MSKSGTIIIVDDNKGVLTAVEILLKSYFSKVVTLSSPVTLITVMQEEMPEDSPVIRMGGDEFMILGNGIAEEKASELMANIRESLKRKSKEKLPLSLAMGSYTVQSKDFSFEEVCHEADLRMYADKKRLKADESTLFYFQSIRNK